MYGGFIGKERLAAGRQHLVRKHEWEENRMDGEIAGRLVWER